MRARWLLPLAVLLVASGCTGPSAPPAGPAGAPPDPRYGAAPERHPDVTYQPDVVFVAGGARVVRGVGPDGLTWRIDPEADGADDLARGKVMFLTGRSVGRVLDTRTEGSDLVVTLGPVAITEVIRDGVFSTEAPVALSGATASEAGQPPWAEVDAEPEAGKLGRAVPGRRGQLAAGLSVEPVCCANGVGASFGYDSGGIRVRGEVTVRMSAPKARFHLAISGATVTEAELSISGGAGLRVALAGATRLAPGNNLNKHFAVPVRFSVPIGQILGVPFEATVDQLVGIQTAFGARDGNIEASGDWSFGGALGFRYQNGAFTVEAPRTLSVSKSLTDSIHGISIGVNGLIVDYQAKFHVGIGVLGFTAGLYVGFAATTAVTIGSAAGAPIKLCRGAQLSLWVSYGVGYRIPASFATAINAFLRLVNATPIPRQGGIGDVKNVLNRSVIDPDEPICRR